MHTVIIEGFLGRVLFSVRGGESAKVDWISEDYKHATGSEIRIFDSLLSGPQFMMLFFGLPGDTHFRHVLPTENDISQEEALEIAKAQVQKRFGTSEEEVESHFVDFMFISGWQYNDQERTADTIWSVGFYSAELDEWGYWVPICGVEISSADGKVIGVSMPGV